MYGLLMDGIVKMRWILAGNFIYHQIKIITEINILEKKQRSSIDYLGQRNGHTICILGNEEDSFLN